MKFRKAASTSSPKMELLSRRSTTNDGRMSTLKRSRSFRASVKLISKIRNRAAFRLASGFEISPVSSKDQCKTTRVSSKDFEKAKQQQELPRTFVNSMKNEKKSNDKRNERIKDKDISQEDRRTPSETNSSIDAVESREITKDFEKKLSLDDRISMKNQKDLERSLEGRIEDETKSPKVIRIFRRKMITDESSKKRNDQEVKAKGKLEKDEHVYENPTFSLDSSLDSSFASIEINVKNEEHITREERNECVVEKTNFEEQRLLKSLLSNKSDLKYVRSFSMREDRSFGRDKSPGYERNDRPRTNFYSETEIDASSRSKEKYNRDLRSCIENTDSVCPTKSCRNRTVDNLTNFWTNARGGSFRSKMCASKKKLGKESKDLESIGQDRVLVTTTSGSSTLDRRKAFH